ncbi:MAG TPA: hypothetical protein VJB99_01295 [Patescibacteria group bacterium]|nr:hypothetical protein [Patescibacteria group bacterium]
MIFAAWLLGWVAAIPILLIVSSFLFVTWCLLPAKIVDKAIDTIRDTVQTGLLGRPDRDFQWTRSLSLFSGYVMFWGGFAAMVAAIDVPNGMWLLAAFVLVLGSIEQIGTGRGLMGWLYDYHLRSQNRLVVAASLYGAACLTVAFLTATPYIPLTVVDGTTAHAALLTPNSKGMPQSHPVVVPYAFPIAAQVPGVVDFNPATGRITTTQPLDPEIPGWSVRRGPCKADGALWCYDAKPSPWVRLPIVGSVIASADAERTAEVLGQGPPATSKGGFPALVWLAVVALGALVGASGGYGAGERAIRAGIGGIVSAGVIWLIQTLFVWVGHLLS